MLLLDAENAAGYLRDSGRIGRDEQVEVRELSGGVSNVVLHVARSAGDDFVLKQARGQLRVADPWFCSVERIWREVETLQVCRELLDRRAGEGGGLSSHAAAIIPDTPRVLFEDRENFAFAMTSAPENHRVWKNELLAGRVDLAAAEACGELLAALHRGAWGNAQVARRLADRQYFVALRVDPYYRRVSEVHPELGSPLEALIDSLEERRLTIVHGDFSPKNLLLFDRSLWLIDCEVGHYGDPAFDLGFFVSHLVLKWIRSGDRQSLLAQACDRFWEKYRQGLADSIGYGEFASLERHAMANLGGCLLARVDGKSKVDYLNSDQQAVARRLGGSLLTCPVDDWRQARSRAQENIP